MMFEKTKPEYRLSPRASFVATLEVTVFDGPWGSVWRLISNDPKPAIGANTPNAGVVTLGLLLFKVVYSKLINEVEGAGAVTAVVRTQYGRMILIFLVQIVSYNLVDISDPHITIRHTQRKPQRMSSTSTVTFPDQMKWLIARIL